MVASLALGKNYSRNSGFELVIVGWHCQGKRPNIRLNAMLFGNLFKAEEDLTTLTLFHIAMSMTLQHWQSFYQRRRLLENCALPKIYHMSLRDNPLCLAGRHCHFLVKYPSSTISVFINNIW